MEDDRYELSDSEDDYSKEDKLLLESARDLMRGKEVSSDEEVYGFGGSDSDEENDGEEGGDDIDMGSDLEDEEKAPDDRAWGKRKRSFYSTDFVDQDYDGIYQGDEAEEAELEEQEAKNIQKHLVEQLNDADFSIHEAVDVAEATEVATKEEVIQSDLSKLTKRQKIDLVKKESPEFFVLVEDLKAKLKEAQEYTTIVNYFKGKVKESFPALDFVQTKLTATLNYCTNISYYLFLKAKRIPVKNHPVLKSLYQFRQLLQKMEETDKKIIKPQVDKILKLIESGKEVPIDDSLVEKKTTLKLLSKNKKLKEKQKAEDGVKQKESNGKTPLIGNNEIEDTEMDLKEGEVISDEKRAITYEMAKNKGLIPKRSKEQRNPRVKHRRKYEKAKIRRRGQVRTPRSEIPVYGGEPTGIKIGLTKSIKLKY